MQGSVNKVIVLVSDKLRSMSGSRRPSNNSSPLKNQLRRDSNSNHHNTNNVDIKNPDSQVINIVSRHLTDAETNLQTPGGDITRDLYKWADDHPIQVSLPQNVGDSRDGNSVHSRRRSMSVSGASVHSGLAASLKQQQPETVTYSAIAPDIPPPPMSREEILAPGGFRRSFLINKHKRQDFENPLPGFLTRNFIEFLTLYGHFAGEDLSESEDDEDVEFQEEHSNRPLLRPTITRESFRSLHRTHKATTVKAVLLLLKSFVGTGVLFLPKAFHNGGWGFSTICLLLCAILSYYCFVCLISTKDLVQIDGYGNIGQHLYGSKMKFAILLSIALSQIGFSAAYVVFTATNLQIFCKNTLGIEFISVGGFIFLQALIFIPLSLARNITKLSGTALLADLFILLGIMYVYYYAGYYVMTNGIATDTMLTFNRVDWSLFIGTAIFTFEGIGLLIPIQESMKHPEHFQPSLLAVMTLVAFIFISSGLLCYSAFGSSVETVVLLNFPQTSPLTWSVQLLYAVAILLSTPLQLFPAIRILENWTFPTAMSGKHDPRVKWMKNYFRSGIVLVMAAIAWAGANDLDKFVSLVGSFACIPLIYIYPPMLHFRAFFSHNKKITFSLIMDGFILSFGVCVMMYTSWQTVSLWVS